MGRIAIFGGTFDPVHLGHLVPALRAVETFGFERLVFMPAARPPHKTGQRLTPFSHRFAMLALATQGYDRLYVSDLELAGDGPTYTVDTLRRFRQEFPLHTLYFVMGSDSFSQIASWYRWRELVDEACLVVLHRETAWGAELRARVPECLHSRLRRVETFLPVPDPPSGEPLIYLLDHEPFPVSSSQLRDRQGQGLTIGELVPPDVHRYLVKYRLYGHGETLRHES